MSDVTVSVSMTKQQQGAMYMQNMRLKEILKEAHAVMEARWNDNEAPSIADVLSLERAIKEAGP